MTDSTENTQRVLHVTQDQDIIEIGTPSKGAVKIHCDINNLPATAAKIKDAMLCLSKALYEYDVVMSAHGCSPSLSKKKGTGEHYD